MNSYTILDARVVQEPKTINLNDGKKLVKLRLADNPSGKKDDKRPARFVTAKAFGVRGEALARLSKGDVIAVEGSLQIETYEKDGQTKTDDVLMIDKFRVSKSESFYAEHKPAAPADSQNLDDMFGGPQ